MDPAYPVVAMAADDSEEYLAMAGGLADSEAPSTGTTRLPEWITQNRATLGTRYAHEIRRHLQAPERRLVP